MSRKNKEYKRANRFLKFLVFLFTIIIILGITFLLLYNQIVERLFAKMNLVDLNREEIGISEAAKEREKEEIKTVLFLRN